MSREAPAFRPGRFTHHWDLKHPLDRTCLCGYKATDPSDLQRHQWRWMRRGESASRHVALSLAVEKGLVTLPESFGPLATPLSQQPGPANTSQTTLVSVPPRRTPGWNRRKMFCRYQGCNFFLPSYNPRGMARHIHEEHSVPPPKLRFEGW